MYPSGKTGHPKTVRSRTRRQLCVNLCDVPDSERNQARFTELLKEIMKRAALDEYDVGRMAGRHRSQVNQWINGNSIPKVQALRQLTDMLRAKYQGLGTLPTQLMIAAGYREYAGSGEAAAAETPACGFVVDLGDENERLLWEGLKLERRLKEVLIAFLRMIKSTSGKNAINSTFDEARQDRHGRSEIRRRA